MDIRRSERRPTPDLDPDSTPVRERPPPQPRRDIVDLPARETPELLAFYAGLRGNVIDPTTKAPVRSRDDAARAAIDAKRDAYAGPYRVEGHVVSATPMFRLGGGYPSQKHVNELGRIVVDKDLVAAAQLGQGSPATIVLVTQRLIDAGKLPPPPGVVATRIKQMQWQYGVGIDCACYTRQCLAAVTGKVDSQLGIAADLGLRRLDRNPHFVKVSPSEVRPGDVMTLDPKPPEAYGHNVIVRDRVVADDACRAEIGRHGPIARAFVGGEGPYHVIQVDSSWGAGASGADHGGYRRDTWIYDEAHEVWGHSEPASGVFKTSKDGPSDWDTFHGAYRVKGGG